MDKIDIAIKSMDNGIVCMGEENLVFEFDDNNPNEKREKIEEFLKYVAAAVGIESYTIRVEG